MKARKNLGLSIHPFCEKVKRDPLETECTDDRSSVALCNLVQHPHALPPHFQVSQSGNAELFIKLVTFWQPCLQ